MCRGGELGHVETDLGDDDLRGSLGDAGDLVEAFHRRETVRPGVAFDRYVAGCQGAAVVVALRRLGVGQLGDELFDPGGEPVDLVGAGVDVVEQKPGQVGVVVVETAVERFEQRGPLGVELPPGEIGEDRGVAFDRR